MKFYRKILILILISVSLVGSNGWALPPAIDPVCLPTSPNSALVVIDMQAYFANRMGFHKNSKNAKILEKLEAAQIEAIKQARAQGIPIAIIEYDLKRYSKYIKKEDQKTNPKLLENLEGYSSEKWKVIQKSTDGLFDRSNSFLPEIKDFLKSHRVGTLLMTGANGGACVAQSIVTGLNNQCHIVAYTAAIADLNYPDFQYPYSGRYRSQIEKSEYCEDCSLKEVHNIEGLTEEMKMYPNEKSDNVINQSGAR